MFIPHVRKIGFLSVEKKVTCQSNLKEKNELFNAVIPQGESLSLHSRGAVLGVRGF